MRRTVRGLLACAVFGLGVGGWQVLAPRSFHEDRPLFRRWADVLIGQDVDPDQALVEAGAQAVRAVAPTVREMNACFLEQSAPGGSGRAAT